MKTRQFFSDLIEYIEQHVFKDYTTVGIPQLYDVYLVLMQISDQSSTAKPSDAKDI